MQIGVACSLGMRQSDSHQIAHNAKKNFPTKFMHKSKGCMKMCTAIASIHPKYSDTTVGSV